MVPWIIFLLALPLIIGLSLVNSVRMWIRGLVVRHPVLAAHSFLSVSTALWLAWLFDVPVVWAIKWMGR